MLRLAALLLLLSFAACSPPAPSCDTTNCTGCCDAQGTCQAGNVGAACGQLGLACSICQPTDSCVVGLCISRAGSGGGAGGGGGGGGGGGTTPTDAGLDHCAVATTSLVFATTALTTTQQLTFTLTNTTADQVAVSVTQPDDGTSFYLSTSGSLPLPPGQTLSLVVNYRPQTVGTHTTFFNVAPANDCLYQRVTLEGRAVATLFEWTPTTLDFGYLAPTTELLRDVTFSNHSDQPVAVTNLAVSTTAPQFRLVTGTSLTVAPGGTASATIGFRPTVLGPRLGVLNFNTSLPMLLVGSVSLRGSGGAPALSVAPTLDFGRVAYFPTASPPTSQARDLEVSNSGPRIAPPDARANLHFGVNGQVPYFDVVPGSGTAAGEFTVAFGASYDPVLGLDSGASLPLRVTFTPVSAGLKAADLVIHSNDPSSPDRHVALTARGVTLSPCTGLTVAEALPLEFGQVAPGSVVRRGFTLTNTGANLCLLSNLQVASAPYALGGGPIAEFELAPGEKRTFIVELSPVGVLPTTPMALNGQVTVFVSSPTAPVLSLALSATVGQNCLVLVPGRELDFGTTAPTCRSVERVVRVHNQCAVTVTLNSSALVGAPFSATAALVNGTVVQPGGAPLVARYAWRPPALGRDVGALVVTATQNGVQLKTALFLQGTATAQGVASETFVSPVTPKADVLLIVDDSCSMSDKQQALAANLTSFLNYANSTGVDYHLGVTTTDMVAVRGSLQGTPAVLLPTTPNLLATAAGRVIVGTNGDAIEQVLAPALAALTPPLRYGVNAGFLRADATLGVISVSDADDQSPLPVSTYLDLLTNLKGPNQLTFSGLMPLSATPPVANCVYDGVASVRTLAAVNGLGGDAEEICNLGWASALGAIGPKAFGFRTTFALAGSPDVASTTHPLSVSVGGVPFPAGQWTYDAATRRVTIAPPYAPAPSDALTVSYAGLCLP